MSLDAERLWPAVVVGAGPAGLATSGELTRRGVPHLVLEEGATIAARWVQLYDSLTLHTGKHMSALPGMSFPHGTPLFPSRRDFLDYLSLYANTLKLPVRVECGVRAVAREEGAWRLMTPQGQLRARRLVVATGILSNPVVPELPGRALFAGRVMHSSAYKVPAPFIGRSVLVVGAGNSAGEIAAELSRAGSRVTVSVRSGALTLPRQVLGVPIQYFAVLMTRVPRGAQQAIKRLSATVAGWLRGPSVLPAPPPTSCPDVPLIGYHLVDAIRSGAVRLRGGIATLVADGARFRDGVAEPFDDVILATGYRAAVGIVERLIRVDECGFARREGRVASVDQLDLYFVGHNYDTTGGLYNIRRDSRIAARRIAAA